MKTYISDIFNKINRFSEKLDAKTVLCNKSWWVFNDEGEKETYIFKDNGSIIIVKSGNVTDGTWELLTFNQSIIIRANEQKVMLKPSFVDNVLLALQVDGTNKFAFLIDEQNKKCFAPQSYTEVINYVETHLINDDDETTVNGGTDNPTIVNNDPIVEAKNQAEILIDDWKQNLLGVEIALSSISVLIILILFKDERMIPLILLFSFFIIFGLLHVFDKVFYKEKYIETRINKYIKEHPDDIVNQYLKRFAD